MSGQRASCCGAADEATIEPTGQPAETTDQVAAGKIEAHQAVSGDRRPSGLIQAIRRLFGAAGDTERA